MANLSGNATITTGGFDALNNSAISISDSVEINGASSTNDNSTVNWSGGSFVAGSSSFNMLDTSMTTITGGTFTCNQLSGGCLRAFDSSSLTIFDAVINGGGSSVTGIGNGPAKTQPQITIHGGTYSEGLQAHDGTLMDIFGGDFDNILSDGGGAWPSTITIFGSNFLATCDHSLSLPTQCDDGEVVVNGFGVIDINFGGTITGTLSDGMPLNITEAFVRGFTNNRIILAPVPIPAAVWLFGSAIGLLGWMRRRQN